MLLVLLGGGERFGRSRAPQQRRTMQRRVRGAGAWWRARAREWGRSVAVVVAGRGADRSAGRRGARGRWPCRPADRKAVSWTSWGCSRPGSVETAAGGAVRIPLCPPAEPAAPTTPAAHSAHSSEASSTRSRRRAAPHGVRGLNRSGAPAGFGTRLATDVPAGGRAVVRAGNLTGVRTRVPTALRTRVPTAVRTRVPTVVRTPIQTGVRTGVPTAVRTPVQTGVRTGVPAGVSSGLPPGLPSRLPPGLPSRLPSGLRARFRSGLMRRHVPGRRAPRIGHPRRTARLA